MKLNEIQRKLLKIGGLVIFFFFILGTILIIYLGYDNHEAEKIEKKIIAAISSNMLCWIVDICLVIFIIPKSRFNRWISFYIPSYIIIIIFALIIGKRILPILFPQYNWKHDYSPYFHVFILNTVALLCLELIISKYEEEKIKSENASLKIMSLQVQHEKLKHQLHPHFLFNSLNALKSLIKKDPEQAEIYLLKLSDFLRFSISHNEHNIVLLKDELKFSMNYLEMQKTRFKDCLSYTVDIPETIINSAKLPVYSLQLLIENAIKHNGLTYENPLIILIKYISPDLILIENNLTTKLNIEHGTGIGLKNLSERYMLLIQKDIELFKTDTSFKVYLKII